jgi:hypothetical protein
MKRLICFFLLLPLCVNAQIQSNSTIEKQFQYTLGQEEFLQNIIPTSENNPVYRQEKIRLFRLVSQVESTNRLVCRYSAEQIRSLGQPAIRILTNWLETPNSIFWQPTMITALGCFGSQASNTIPMLWDFARHIDSTLQPRAMVALIRIKEQPVPAITNWLQPANSQEYYLHDGHGYLYSAIALLGDDAKPLYPFLIQTLKNSSSRDAVLAGQTLGQLKVSPNICVPELIRFLETPDFWSPDRALDSLSAYGTLAASARPSVEKILKNPQAPLLARIPAIHAVVEITPVNMRETLLPLLRNLPGDEDGVLKEEAEKEIRRIQQH